MTEQPLLPMPGEQPASAAASAKTTQREIPPWLYGLGFLVLAAAIFYAWQHPVSDDATSRNGLAVQALQQRLAVFDGRLDRLEQRPTPDVGKLTARLDAVEARIPDLTQIPSRMDALSGRIESLSARGQTGLDATKRQLDALTDRIAALESNAGGVDAVTRRLNRVAKLQEAALALAAGRPVGDLPDAPEALARFAHIAPPTEAELRLEFPKAEHAALTVNQPDTSSAPFIGRVWERAQGLLTIRQGDDLVIGNESAGILNEAQAALDAGDLPAAVKAVEGLRGPPAQAMTGWLGKARALLSARSALANMTEQA